LRLIVFAKDPQEEMPISIINDVAIAHKQHQLLGSHRLFHHQEMLLIKHALNVVDLELSLALRHHQEGQHAVNFVEMLLIVSPIIKCY
jgi:hypothetical protein